MQHKGFFSIFFVIVVLLSGCAKQGMPTGGPKDVDPPVQKRTVPENRSLGFDGNQFFIEFDEYVVIKDAENNILVSPPMKHKPEYKTKGRGIQVKMNDTLQPNTTYVFQFKDAIADYNEGNLLPSLEYVFSTGDYIDSMTIRGRVVDALTYEPREEAVNVWLMSMADGESFANSFGDTAAPVPTLAYATRCTKDGSFSFNYIKPNKYKIFAVQDENKNQQLDAGESIAFISGEVEAKNMKDSIEVDSVKKSVADTGNLQLLIFTPQTERQRITGSGFTAAGKVRITTKLPLLSPTIDCGGEKTLWRLNASRDTLTVWTLRQKCDSLQMIVSDDSGIQDTLKLRWRSKKGAAAASTQVEMKLNYSKLPYFDTLALLFSTPLASGQSGDSVARIFRLKDSTETFCPVVIDSSLMRANIIYDFLQGEKYSVSVAKDCLKDIYNQGNDSLKAVIEVTKVEEYGNLSVEIKYGAPMVPTFVIVELLNEKGTVVASRWVLPMVQNAKFEHLTPGKYRVRAIVDNNHNQKWDTGDFSAGIQPERVVYLPKTLDIRANWDFEEKMEL